MRIRLTRAAGAEPQSDPRVVAFGELYRATLDAKEAIVLAAERAVDGDPRAWQELWNAVWALRRARAVLGPINVEDDRCPRSAEM